MVLWLTRNNWLEQVVHLKEVSKSWFSEHVNNDIIMYKFNEFLQ